MKRMKAKVIMSALDHDGQGLEREINQWLELGEVNIEDMRLTAVQEPTGNRIVCVIFYEEKGKRKKKTSIVRPA